MRVILQVALGVLVLLAFGKAQTNENEAGDEQHDLVPCSCEEEAAMIESLLEDVGRKAREKDSVVSEMRLEFEQIECEKAEEFASTLAQRDTDISELRTKVLKFNETSGDMVKNVIKTNIQIQSQRDEIVELEKEAKRMELEFEESLKGVRLELETSENILKALGDVLMVDNENLLEKVKEMSLLASHVQLIEENNHSEDADPGEGNKAPRPEEMGDDHDDLKGELQRVQQELDDVRWQSLEEVSRIQGKGQAFVSHVSELIDELVACRTGEKEMGILGGSREMLDAMQKLNEEVKACRHGSWEQGTESNMEDRKNEVQNLQLDNLVSQLESYSGRLLQVENETQVLVELLNEETPLLHQAESLLSGLQGLEGELKGWQEGEEDSEQNETRKNVGAEIVKHLSDALIIGRELAGLNSNLTDIQLVADVQDIGGSSHSNADKGMHVAKPREEDIERERQERIEMNVDTQGQVSFSPDDDSLQSRIAELEEELVACREKDELHSVRQELFNDSLIDEDILTSTDSVEEELQQPEKSYNSFTSDYKSLSTFIGDVLAVGASLASTGMKNTYVDIRELV